MKEKQINDLLEQWIVFRDEELSHLTNEDRKHPLHFEAYGDKLLKSLPYRNREQTKIILDKMYYNVIDYLQLNFLILEFYLSYNNINML